MVKSLFSLDSDDDNADNDVAVMDEVLLQSKGATMVGSKRGKEEEEEEEVVVVVVDPAAANKSSSNPLTSSPIPIPIPIAIPIPIPIDTNNIQCLVCGAELDLAAYGHHLDEECSGSTTTTATTMPSSSKSINSALPSSLLSKQQQSKINAIASLSSTAPVPSQTTRTTTSTSSCSSSSSSSSSSTSSSANDEVLSSLGDDSSPVSSTIKHGRPYTLIPGPSPANPTAAVPSTSKSPNIIDGMLDDDEDDDRFLVNSRRLTGNNRESLVQAATSPLVQNSTASGPNNSTTTITSSTYPKSLVINPTVEQSKSSSTFSQSTLKSSRMSPLVVSKSTAPAAVATNAFSSSLISPDIVDAATNDNDNVDYDDDDIMMGFTTPVAADDDDEEKHHMEIDYNVVVGNPTKPNTAAIATTTTTTLHPPPSIGTILSPIVKRHASLSAITVATPATTTATTNTTTTGTKINTVSASTYDPNNSVINIHDVNPANTSSPAKSDLLLSLQLLGADMKASDILVDSGEGGGGGDKPSIDSTTSSAAAVPPPPTTKNYADSNQIEQQKEQRQPLRQSSLHKFLNLPDLRPSRFFYLKWTDEKNPRVVFTDELPHDTKFQANVYWKEQGITLMICSNLESARERPDLESHLKGAASMLPSYRIQAVPLLKSHLQKCIRRSRENLAVRTARHLLLTDPEALLRRLPVIMVEDAVLNIQLPAWVWFTCAVSKGFQLDIDCIEWILGMVDATAETAIRDPIAPLDPVPPRQQPLHTRNSATTNSTTTGGGLASAGGRSTVGKKGSSSRSALSKQQQSSSAVAAPAVSSKKRKSRSSTSAGGVKSTTTTAAVATGKRKRAARARGGGGHNRIRDVSSSDNSDNEEDGESGGGGEEINTGGNVEKDILRPVLLDSKQVFELPAEMKWFLYALALRKSYGGTPGDVSRLEAAIAVWMRRFQVLIDISAGRILETSVDPNLFRLDKEFRRTIPFIDIKSVRPIKPNEWELCAVDFHVSSIIDMWKSRLKPDHVKQYQTGNIFSAFPSSKNIMGSGVGVTANSTAGMRKNGVDLNDILTRIMWKYGSGLNVKREIVVMGLDYVPTRVSSSSSSFSLLPFAGEDVQSPDIHDKWKRAFYEEYLPVLNELARSIIQRYVE